MYNEIRISENNAQQTFNDTMKGIEETFGKQIVLINEMINNAVKRLNFSVKVYFQDVEGMDDNAAKHLKEYYISKGYNVGYYYSKQYIRIYWGMIWNNYSLENY